MTIYTTSSLLINELSLFTHLFCSAPTNNLMTLPGGNTWKFKVRIVNLVPRHVQVDARFQLFDEILGCRNESRHCKYVSYHHLPKRPMEQAVWLQWFNARKLRNLKTKHWLTQVWTILGDAHLSLVTSPHFRDATLLWWESVEVESPLGTTSNINLNSGLHPKLNGPTGGTC